MYGSLDKWKTKIKQINFTKKEDLPANQVNQNLPSAKGQKEQEGDNQRVDTEERVNSERS